MKPVLSFSNRSDLLKTITAVFSRFTDNPYSIQYSYNRFIMHRRLRGSKGPSTKDVRQMGRVGVVLKFRTFPDGGGGVVCESSDVRKFLKKSTIQNFSEFFKVKTRNYNRSRFQYESIHI